MLTTVDVKDGGHDVLFYEGEEFLVDAVSRFLGPAVRGRQPIIVIATAKHRRAFADRLRHMGLALDEFGESRDWSFLDARETLAAFMEGGRPVRELFDATVGSVIERLVRNRPHSPIRAYGEMVDLLWADGRAAAALELEDLWNDLAHKYRFSLLCAYARSSMNPATGDLTATDICRRHLVVHPPESLALGQHLGLHQA